MKRTSRERKCRGRREHAGEEPREQGPRAISGALRRQIQIGQRRLRRLVAFLDSARGGTVIDGSSSPRCIEGLAPEAFCTVHDATSNAGLKTRRPIARFATRRPTTVMQTSEGRAELTAVEDRA